MNTLGAVLFLVFLLLGTAASDDNTSTSNPVDETANEVEEATVEDEAPVEEEPEPMVIGSETYMTGLASRIILSFNKNARKGPERTSRETGAPTVTPTGSPTETPTSVVEGLAARWRLDLPEMTYDASDDMFALDFVTSSSNNVAGDMRAEFYDAACRTAVSAGILDSFGSAAPAMTMNGAGKKPQLKFMIDAETLSNNPGVYEITGGTASASGDEMGGSGDEIGSADAAEELSGSFDESEFADTDDEFADSDDGVSTDAGELGVMTFCLRSSLGYTSTSDEYNEVNYIQSLISIQYDISNGFELVAFAIEEKEETLPPSEFVEEYAVEAWVCDPSQTEQRTDPERELPIPVEGTVSQGDEISICLAPDGPTYSDGVVIGDVMNFKWKRKSPRVKQEAIYGGEALTDGMTSYECQPNQWCVITSVLFAEFFASPGEVTGSGGVALEFQSMRQRRLDEDDGNGNLFFDFSDDSEYEDEAMDTDDTVDNIFNDDFVDDAFDDDIFGDDAFGDGIFEDDFSMEDAAYAPFDIVIEVEGDEERRNLRRRTNSDYELDAWVCDPTEMEVLTNPSRTLPKRNDQTAFAEGDMVTVCVAPNDVAFADGIVISKLTKFDFKRDGITQKAIDLGEEADILLTTFDHEECSGAEFCFFGSILFADFFDTAGEVYGTGTGDLEFRETKHLRTGVSKNDDGWKLHEEIADDMSFGLTISVVPVPAERTMPPTDEEEEP